eukprot:3505559-Amphidinium_carterae.1
MINIFEAMEFEGFPITSERRVRRLHTDRARELTSDFLDKFLTRYPQVLHTHTRGYDPQANGTAERGVGMIKTLVSRSLAHSGLPREFWSFAALYAAQALLCKALQRKQKSPPFGSMVISRTLNPPKKIGATKGVEGRLLFWDHLFSSQSSVLTSNPTETSDHYVETAGYPVPSPPNPPMDVTPINLEDDKGEDHLPEAEMDDP